MEARIQAVNSPATWSGFWMWVDSYGSSTPYNPHMDGTEPDIMEHRGYDWNNADNYSGTIDSALHWDSYDQNEKSLTSGQRGTGLNSGYHTYGLLWTATSQTFTIDDNPLYTYTINDDPQLDPPSISGSANPTTGPVSHISEYILLTTEVQNNSWAGIRPTAGYGTMASSTTLLNVDYVRVYQLNPPTPSAPSDLTAANVAGGLSLSWSLVDNAPYYNIKRSTTSGGPYTTIATTGVGYTDTTLVSGSTYYYVVSAVNGPAESPNSAEVTNNDSLAPGYAHSGLYAAKGVFSGSASFFHIYQSVAVSASTNYVASLWLKGSGTIRFVVKGGSTNLTSEFLAATGDWTNYSVAFNSGTNTQVTFYFDDSSTIVGSVSVDDTFLGVSGGTNLLANPGFESGSTSWNVSTGSIWTIGVNLAAPAALSGSAVSETQALLNWTNVAPYSTAIVLQRSPQGAGNWTTLSGGLAPATVSYLDSTASASTSYDYRIQCIVTSGTATYSSPYATATIAIPAGIGDGIPGWWRYMYFGNGLTLSASSAALADPDRDGMTNMQEYLAGTSPIDPNDYLHIAGISRSGSGTRISFPTVQGKTYLIEQTGTLGSGAVWSVVQDSIGGTGATVSGTDAGGVLYNQRFYRVRLK
jgi:hypothetical protein